MTLPLRASLPAAVMLWVLAGVGWLLIAGVYVGVRSWSPSAAFDRKCDEKRRSVPLRARNLDLSAERLDAVAETDQS